MKYLKKKKIMCFTHKHVSLQQAKIISYIYSICLLCVTSTNENYFLHLLYMSHKSQHVDSITKLQVCETPYYGIPTTYNRYMRYLIPRATKDVVDVGGIKGRDVLNMLKQHVIHQHQKLNKVPFTN